MRVKHAASSQRWRRKVLKKAKGYWGDRSRKYRRAVETLRKAYTYAYRDRRAKKREFRSLWINRLNAAARVHGLSYNLLMHQLKQKNMLFSRDVLAKIAAEHPEIFDQIIEALKS